MRAAPVKISGLGFALFLEKQRVNGVALFGPQYLGDPAQLKTLCGVFCRRNPLTPLRYRASLFNGMDRRSGPDESHTARRRPSS